MKFRNQQNGFVEVRTAPWLWALLFGGFYFMVVGAWVPVIIWFVLAVVLYASMGAPATVLMLIVGVIYAALAPGLVRSAYLKKGWIEVTGDSITPSTSIRKCPFCAEVVLYEAVKCKHCNSELPPPPQPSETYVDESGQYAQR